MKKLLSCILAALMISSAACMATGATVLYTDDFENGKNEEFWGGIGRFVVDEGTMNGFTDAKIAQANYDHDEINTEDFIPFDVSPESKCYNELTLWIDVKVDEGDMGDYFGAGFWLTDTYEVTTGIADQRTIYNLTYFAKEEVEGADVKNAFARLYSDSPMKDKEYPDHVYGELALPEAFNEKTGSGFNGNKLEGTGKAVKLGLRYGKGNITGYANGKIVGSYNYDTIGLKATPIVLNNYNCYVEFDNFGLGTYDENVRLRTIDKDTYVPAAGKVTVTNNEASYDYTEDGQVKITAPAEAGKSFDKWEMKIGGKVVDISAADPDVAGSLSGIEKTELLYGIEIGDLNASELTFTMPNADVELTAVYKEAVAHKVTVSSGTADPASAAEGVKVTVTADAAPAGKSFDKWVVKSGDITLANANLPTTTFVMVDADVELEATYKEGETMKGDVNGDKNLDAKDILAIMKHLLNKTPADFDVAAADFNGDGNIDAKDILAIMKAILNK